MHAQEPGEVPGKWHAEVFLAFASEDQKVAHATLAMVNDCAASAEGGEIVVKPWPLTAKLSASILQSLQDSMDKVHFGIFLFTPIDVMHSSEQRSPRDVARDNVVFEAGMFIGKKGIDHTLMLLPEGHQVMPSDLAGIIGIRYPFDTVHKLDNLDDRKTYLLSTCEKIVDRIQYVMAQHSVSQQPPNAGQAPTVASVAQPASPLELFGATLMADAAQGNLPALRDEDVRRGRLVVHALHGVGQIVAFDPPDQQPRYITVRFGSSPSVSDISELFVTPKIV